MAFPVDVNLVTVTGGAAYSSFGVDAEVSIEVEPIYGGNLEHLVHKNTGTIMFRNKDTFKGTPGQPGSFTIADPTQTETWIDGNGQFFSGWPHTATITIRPKSGKPVAWTKSFNVEPGQTHIDLDLIPNGQIGGGVSGPVPAVTSVNGQAGAVVIEAATDAGTAGFVATGVETKAALDAAAAEAMATPGSATNTELTAAIVNEGGEHFVGKDGGVLIGTNGKKYAVVACALRNLGAPNYWQPIDDAGHNPVNVGSVITNSAAIIMNFATTGIVVFGTADVDETMTAYRYKAGASVGQVSMNVRIAREHLDDYISWNGTVFTSNNGNMSPAVMNGAGTLILTHSAIGGFGVSLSALNSPLRPVMVSLTATQTMIQFRNPDGTIAITPSSDMKVYVSREGGAQIDPRLAGLETDANLWVYAILETA